MRLRHLVKRTGICVCMLVAVNIYFWGFVPWNTKETPTAKPIHTRKGSDEYEDPKSDGIINVVHVPKTKSEEVEIWNKYEGFWGRNTAHEDVMDASDLLAFSRRHCKDYSMPVKGNGRRDVMWLTSSAPVNCTLLKLNVLVNEMRGKTLKDNLRLRKNYEDEPLEFNLYGNAELQGRNGSYMEMIEDTPQIYLMLLKYEESIQEYAYPDQQDAIGDMLDLSEYEGLEFATGEGCTVTTPLSCPPRQAIIQDAITGFAVYIHVISHAYVDSLGRVYARSLGIEPNQCESPAMQKPTEFTAEKEVFSIASNAASTALSISRLLPFVDFLRSHAEILIHVSEHEAGIQDYLRMLQLDPGRLRFGSIKAEVVYLPQGHGCKHANSFTLPLLSNLHDDFLQHAILPQELPELANQKTMLFLSDKTHKMHDSLSQTAFANALKHDYDYEEFHISHDRPFLHSLVTFHWAAIIVVVGNPTEMDNITLCSPKTVVIHIGELNPYFVELCWKLGLVYKGFLLPDDDTNIKDLLQRFEELVKWFLQ